MNESKSHTTEAHRFYDHPSVEGDAVSELRDELVKRGWDCVVAHTGGGCMSVSVLLNDELGALVGPDAGVGVPLGEVTSGGMDVESHLDTDDPYLGSLNFECEPGGFVDAADRLLEDVRDGKVEPR